MEVLRAARSLGLPQWCIGAGAVRNVVWDRLHGIDRQAYPATDVDVVYFDPDDTDPQRDRKLAQRLTSMAPAIDWEVVNQAGVHQWYGQVYGVEMAPLTSTEDGLGTWPEICSAVGVRLAADDQLEVLAPFGLGDLFEMVVRHNTRLVPSEIYRRRIETKGWRERWPQLTVVDA